MKKYYMQRAGRLPRAAVVASLLWSILLSPGSLRAERQSGQGWELLAVAYPADREVVVELGGAARTLAAKGLAKVKWHDKAAAMELEIEGLPAPAEAGFAGTQYVLWAVDNDKRAVNLGLVPGSGKQAKWKLQGPFRIFGLLVTAEKNPQASAPSNDVALESLLPTDPNLVVPVFRVDLQLAP